MLSYVFGIGPTHFEKLPHTHSRAATTVSRAEYLAGAPVIGQLRDAYPTRIGFRQEGSYVCNMCNVCMLDHGHLLAEEVWI